MLIFVTVRALHFIPTERVIIIIMVISVLFFSVPLYLCVEFILRKSDRLGFKGPNYIPRRSRSSSYTRVISNEMVGRV